MVAIAMLCSCPVFAQKISWKGIWATKHSIDYTFPIIGNIEETTKELSLVFTENLGKVIITVTDSSGEIIYQEPISTGDIPNWAITLDKSIQGGMISITDGINLVYGEFNF